MMVSMRTSTCIFLPMCAVPLPLGLPVLVPPPAAPRSATGPRGTTLFFPPLERKESLPLEVFRMVAAFEAMELCRRHRQIEREQQQMWRESLCSEVFRWWRSQAAEWGTKLSASSISQIEERFMDQLIFKIDQLVEAAVLPSESKSSD